MKEKILFVDDDPNILEAYQRKLQQALAVDTAPGGRAGLDAVRNSGPYAVVISDMNMPVMDGIEFLSRVKEIAPDTVRMMLTGNADMHVAMDAVNEGSIFRFLTKPCPAKTMGDALVSGIKQYRLITAEKELLEGTLNGTVELLAEILSWVDPDAFGRAIRLRNHVKRVAKKLAVDQTWELGLAATLSQLGWMAIPQGLVEKIRNGEQLTEDEGAALKSIPAVGQELLARIPRLESVAEIVLYQNKHYDGSGFPEDSVAGGDIPYAARVLKVLGDLLTLDPDGRHKVEAFGIMQDRQGWYDPAILETVIRVYESTQADAEGRTAATIQVNLSELRPGLTLASTLETRDGRRLMSAGTLVTEALLVRLNRFASLVGVREPIEVKAPL